MQIMKSTEQKTERSVVPFKQQVKQFPEKVGRFFSASKKRSLIITASVLIICAAIGINWMLFGPADAAGNPAKTDGSGENPSPSQSQAAASNDEEGESFFALAVTDRQKARDEALEVLQTVVDSAASTTEERTAAAGSISRIASYIEAESNIETLVKSKGFEQCVAVVSENNVSVIVGTKETLLAHQLAQIKEIVYLQTGIDPSGMRITEKIL